MRFLRVVIAVWLLLTALIMVAMLYGYVTVAPNVLSEVGFDVCNGQPCFLGIVPGVTTGQEAHKLISRYGDITAYIPGQTMIVRINNIGFALIIDKHSEKI